jgi:hypothetical protein
VVRSSWYPIVFSLYPVLALLAENVGQVKVETGVRPAFVSLSIGVVLFGLFLLILRNVYRAAFLSTLWLALFFSYGHLHIFLVEKYSDVDFNPWLLWGWLILAFFFVWRQRDGILFIDLRTLNAVLGLWIVSGANQFGAAERRRSLPRSERCSHTGIGAAAEPTRRIFLHPGFLWPR